MAASHEIVVEILFRFQRLESSVVAVNGFNTKRGILRHRQSPVGLQLAGFCALSVGLVHSTPAAVADTPFGDATTDVSAAKRVTVAVNVPFSEAELAHALYVRGVVWAKQIRVRLSPAGRVAVDADGNQTEVELDGRIGAAAARVVAVSLVGGASAEANHGRDVASIAPASAMAAAATPNPATENSPGGPGTVSVGSFATVQRTESGNRRWLILGPVFGTLFTGEAEGETLGLEVNLDLFTRKYFRIVGTANILSVRIRVPTPSADYMIRDRPITGRLGISVGPEWLNVQAGPRVTGHFYSGICDGRNEVLTSFFGSIRGLWRLGDRVGLTASIAHNADSLGGQQSANCPIGSGFAALNPERPNVEISSGFAISL